MAGGGPRFGRDDCWGSRPVGPVGAADDGRTGAFILGGSDEVADVVEEVTDDDEDDDDEGRAGRDGGCFNCGTGLTGGGCCCG